MGTITSRKRADGTTGYTARIRLKHGGKVVHAETQTFDREQAAKLWIKKRETELAEPGALERTRAKDPELKFVISQYIKESRRDFGKTKNQVLSTISANPIGSLRCSEIGSPELLDFAKSLNVQPQTVSNYLSHLAAVFRIAKPAWGYPLDIRAMDDARVVGEKMRITGRSKQRDRRPTLDELDILMQHFAEYEHRRRRSNPLPMCQIIAFAIFSTRRQEEICTIKWEDLNVERGTVIVRDMKHPGDKIGNDTIVDMPEPALRLLLKRRPEKAKGIIFPYEHRTVSAYFTRACDLRGIEDLHFHDLRHDGVSRLFEMGYTIPKAASVSGHRTWTSLKRYTHIEHDGDKYAGWHWLEKLGIG